MARPPRMRTRLAVALLSALWLLSGTTACDDGGSATTPVPVAAGGSGTGSATGSGGVTGASELALTHDELAGTTYYVVVCPQGYGFSTLNTDGTRVHSVGMGTFDTSIEHPNSGGWAVKHGDLRLLSEEGVVKRTLSRLSQQEGYRVMSLDPPVQVEGVNQTQSRHYEDKEAAEALVASLAAAGHCVSKVPWEEAIAE